MYLDGDAVTVVVVVVDDDDDDDDDDEEEEEEEEEEDGKRHTRLACLARWSAASFASDAFFAAAAGFRIASSSYSLRNDFSSKGTCIGKTGR